MSTPGKFRGIPIDGGDFVKGCLYQYHPTKVFIIISKDHPADLCTSLSHIRGDFIPVIPETVGQHIGLNDKKLTEEFPNGQPVYERDIVESIWQVDHKTKIVGQVTYYSVFALWSLMDSKGDMVSPCWTECKVIGNMDQHPELLEAH